MKAKFFIGAAVFSMMAAVGCSSGGGSSGGGGGGGGLDCSVPAANLCYIYSGLNSAQNTAESSACAAETSGAVVSSCPTAGLYGCCTTTTGGFSTEDCYYQYADGGGPGASSYMSSCTGTWSTSQ